MPNWNLEKRLTCNKYNNLFADLLLPAVRLHVGIGCLGFEKKKKTIQEGYVLPLGKNKLVLKNRLLKKGGTIKVAKCCTLVFEKKRKKKKKIKAWKEKKNEKRKAGGKVKQALSWLKLKKTFFLLDEMPLVENNILATIWALNHAIPKVF